MNPEQTGQEIEVQEELPQVSQFEGVLNLSRKRGDNELYCDYKCRQWWVKRILNRYLQGTVIWSGHQGKKVGSW